jgi:hypothetical protein
MRHFIFRIFQLLAQKADTFVLSRDVIKYVTIVICKIGFLDFAII